MLAIEEFNLAATEAEVDMLNWLLREHYEKVELESQTLKSANSETHFSVFKYLKRQWDLDTFANRY